MIKIQIKSIFGTLLFEYEKEGNTIKDTLLEALKCGANLTDANLTDANLTDANLTGANLSHVNLAYANLAGVNLTGADLHNANLYGANLTGADLAYTNLRNVDLAYTNLRNVNLAGANFRNANLTGTNLADANLREFKKDLFDVLLRAIPETNNLKKAILEGKINGSTYEGECACLCGTLEKSSQKEIQKRVFDLRDSSRPIEMFFTNINTGDTPENNQFSKLALEWICEFETYI